MGSRLSLATWYVYALRLCLEDNRPSVSCTILLGRTSRVLNDMRSFPEPLHRSEGWATTTIFTVPIGFDDGGGCRGIALVVPLAKRSHG